MKSFRLSLIPLLLTGCVSADRPRSPGVVQTQEIMQTLEVACEEITVSPDYMAVVDDVCACLPAERPELGEELIKEVCDHQGLRRHVMWLRRALLMESLDAFAGPVGGSVEKRTCAEKLVDKYLHSYLSGMATSCTSARVSYSEFRHQFSLPEPSDADQCWSLVQMTEDACLLARPCRGSGPSNLGALPIAGAADTTMIPPAGTVEICHPQLKRMHAAHETIAKMPSHAALLNHGRNAEDISLAPTNCHGVAQALVGGFLEGQRATRISYQSPAVRNNCGGDAEVEFQKAVKSGKSAEVGLLPVARDQHLVSMLDGDCDEKDCGDVAYKITSCAGGKTNSHVFFEGMCKKCWGRLLREAGLDSMGRTATWKELRPGCVLTARHRSVAHLFANNGMCYYLASPSPQDPPQLMVEPCNQYFSKFPDRWCPRAPLSFVLTGES